MKALRSSMIAVLLACGAASSHLGAQDTLRIEQLIPNGTLALVRTRGLGIDVAGLHRVAGRLLAAGGVLGRLLPPRQLDALRAGMARAAARDEDPITRACAALARGELAVGVRYPGRGRRVRPFAIAVLAGAQDASAFAQPLRDRFGLAAEARGRIVVVGDRPTRAVLGAVVARIRGGRPPTHTAQRVASELTSNAEVAAWIDLEGAGGLFLRAALRTPPENAVGALFAGGLGPVLARARYWIVEGRFGWDRVTLDLRVPGVAENLPAPTRAVLGLDDAPVPDVPDTATTLVRARLGRSLAALVLHRKDLAGKRAQRGFEEFLGGVEQLFRGADVERVLFPELKPGFTLVATRARGDEKRPTGHGFRLPTGAIAVGLAGKHLARSLDTAMQVGIIIGNQQRVRTGKLPYRLKARKEDGLRVFSAAMREPRGTRPWPSDAEIAPSFVRSDSHAALGLGVGIAKELVAAFDAAPVPVRGARSVLDSIDVHFDRAAAAVEDARALIAAQLLVSRGLDKAGAGRFVDALVETASLLGTASIEAGLDGHDWFASVDWRPVLGRLLGDGK